MVGIASLFLVAGRMLSITIGLQGKRLILGKILKKALYGRFGRLTDEIRPMVKMMRPATLYHAFEVAKFQEQLLGSSGGVNYNPKPICPFGTNTNLNPTAMPYNISQLHQNFPNSPKPPNTNFTTTLKFQNTTSKTIPSRHSQSSSYQSAMKTPPQHNSTSIKHPSNSQPSSNQSAMKIPLQHNSAGLRQPKPCYRCGEKYFPGHVSKQKSVMAIHVTEADKGKCYTQEKGQKREECHDISQEEEEAEWKQEDMTLSIHAL
ncbi:hypothetical protein P3X46_022167 [Hevea brasiliensis]|uniref:Uncharacterized protein n=1 Tax=Hevea brasiliensis TaxID=3981 RepID=A0ABQ9LHS7_HEVBR|nr:hypothetical protein P3X46_022167 [Hevea brasiliensis]